MPHASPQCSRASRSACRASWSARLCTGRYMKQSSANNLTWEVTTLGRTFMWIKNSKGPGTVPWGTPDKTLACVEYFPSTSTDCDLGWGAVSYSSLSIAQVKIYSSSYLIKRWFPLLNFYLNLTRTQKRTIIIDFCQVKLSHNEDIKLRRFSHE